MLLQLPPRFKAQPERLDRTLAAFARHGVRTAVEVRDDTWYTDEVSAILGRYDAPLVWADRLGRPLGPLWRTASWAYVRLHEGDTTWPCYTEATLDAWARRLPGSGDVFVYSNNDPRGCAVRDAAVFARCCAKAGLDVTRAPAAQDHPPVTPEPAEQTT